MWVWLKSEDIHGLTRFGYFTIVFPGKNGCMKIGYVPSNLMVYVSMILSTKMASIWGVPFCQNPPEGKRCKTLRGSRLIHSSAVARSASVTLVRMSLGVGVASRASCSQPCKGTLQNPGLLSTHVVLSSHDIRCL